MATYSELRIFFYKDIPLGTTMSFDGASTNNHFIWVSFRYAPNQVTLGEPTFIAGERAAINFMEAFNADYNSTGLYEVVRSALVVTIKAKSPTVMFDNFEASVDNTYISPSIANYAGSPFTLDSLTFEEATVNPKCTHYKVSIETSLLTKTVTGTISLSNNTNNPFTFERLRGQGFNLKLTEEGFQSLNVVRSNNNVPSVLSSSNFNLSINNSPSGSTLIVNNTGTNGLSLQYSLDEEDWQTSNTFIGLLPGDYILYIKDNFGCGTSIPFNINYENQTPQVSVNKVSYYSQSNSILMVELDGSNYNTEKNRLSHQYFSINPRLAHAEYHLFKPSHIIPCQLISSYSNVEVKVIKPDGTEDDIYVNKYTNNIGRKDARDAIKFNAGNGKTGIYFNNGKLYDYDTDAYDGNDYSLYGGLPEWATIGNFFKIGSGNYKIENIYYDENLSAEVILIDESYTGDVANIIVKAIFNRQDYEVFEWAIDMSAYNNQTIQVKSIETHESFETINRISEKILIKNHHKDTVEVISWNSKNTDVFYKTGIKHYALVHTASIAGEHEDPSEVNKGDDSSSLIDSKIYEMLLFDFDLLSLPGYRQLTRILSNDTIFIEGTQFVKNGTLEKEGPLEESNLYKLKAKMLYANSSISTYTGGIEIVIDDINIDVPNIKINDAGEFISYQ